MDAVCLLNPAARSGTARPAALRAVERLRARGVRTTTIDAPDAAAAEERLTDAARGADLIVACGGDGTVHLAVQVAAAAGLPLGIVPVGTGNDLAAALGLAGASAEHAADVIADAVAAGAAHERTRTIDLARVRRADGSTRLFAAVLASGFDSLVNDRANALRWPRGDARYTLAILREFLTLKSTAYDVSYTRADGTAGAVSGALLMATVGNARSYGGGIPICPDADMADGLLDLLLVQPVSRARLLRLLPRVYRGTHVTVPEVTLTRVRSVRLSGAAVTGYADGEPIGALPLEIDVLPQALRVLTAG